MILKPVEETEQDRNRFAQIIMSTTLGKTYYPNEAFLRHEIVNAPIEDERFLLADEETNENIGVLWINRRGAFHSFPFLHVIAIRSEYQGRGYGREAMKLFEELCLEDTTGKKVMRTKAFLLVNCDNSVAIRMYEQFGYDCVGEIKGLFRKRTDERIMMKELRRGIQ